MTDKCTGSLQFCLNGSLALLVTLLINKTRSSLQLLILLVCIGWLIVQPHFSKKALTVLFTVLTEFQVKYHIFVNTCNKLRTDFFEISY